MSYGAPIVHPPAWTQEGLTEFTISFIVENDLVRHRQNSRMDQDWSDIHFMNLT